MFPKSVLTYKLSNSLIKQAPSKNTKTVLKKIQTAISTIKKVPVKNKSKEKSKNGFEKDEIRNNKVEENLLSENNEKEKVVNNDMYPQESFVSVQLLSNAVTSNSKKLQVEKYKSSRIQFKSKKEFSKEK